MMYSKKEIKKGINTMADIKHTLLQAGDMLAQQLSHPFIVVEHILFVLLQAPQIAAVLESNGVDTPKLNEELVEYIQDQFVFAVNTPKVNPNKVQFTPQVDALFAGAEKIAARDKRKATMTDVLTVIFDNPNCYGSYFLRKYGVTKEMISQIDKENDKTGNALVEHCQNLSEKVKTNCDPLIGRQKELFTIFHTLSRKKKNNAILVGHGGVGKTAIADGLAQRINSGEVPENLKGMTVWSMDVGSVLAGCKLRGDFEEKIKAILAELVKDKNAILFIDEAHQINSGEGNSSSMGMSFSSMFKPELAKGNIKVIAATTWEGYRQTFEKDSALMRRFKQIVIDEPTATETVLILNGLKKGIEEFHEVKITQKAIEAAVELTIKYQPSLHLPDKAIDIIDSVCARNKISTKKNTISREMVVQEVSDATGIQIRSEEENLDSSKGILVLGDKMKEIVYHQDHAIETIAKSMIVANSGLKDPNKPIGSFFLTGPSGVGKTFAAKILAKEMNMHFLHYSMVEFSEKHEVSRLLGSTPGYVGYDDGKTGEGQLINDISQNPNSVILFDEIEKAHPDLSQVFLQLLDEGTISGGSGKVANAKNCVIIFTSNLGSRDIEKIKTSLGFNRDASTKNATTEAVNAFFLPELRGRVTDIVEFNKLDDISYRKIVTRRVEELANLIKNRKITILATEHLVDHILSKNDSPQYGARKINNLVDSIIKYPLSIQLIEGKIPNGSKVRLDWKNDELNISVDSNKVTIPLET